MTGHADLQHQIRSTVADLPPGVHELSLTAQGLPIQLKLRIEEGATALLTHFHGAVNREIRKVPQFPSWTPGIGKAHQISIPDPSMSLLDRPFNIAWYAGHEGFDTQAILRAIFAAMTESLGVERTIYFGNSGGGFAALYYSHCDPGSFAVVGNPQTDILAHHDAPVSRYLAQCWPSLMSSRDIATATCSSLPALYRQGFENTVIYVQSLGDRFHYVRHMLPFVQAIAGQPNAGRLLMQCDFNGRLGHAAEPRHYLDWMKAIISSPTTDVGEILKTLHSARGSAAPAPPAAPRRAGKLASDAASPTPFDNDDIAMAERLRKWRGRAS